MTPKEYLNSHNLNENFVTSKLGWKLHPDKIEIPIYGINGKRLYSRFRMFSGDNKFITEKGAKLNNLYRISQAIQHDDIVFAEGEPDTAKLWQEGIPAITFPSGVKSLASNTDVALDRIKKIISPLASKTIYLCLDNDEAGQSSVLNLAKKLRSINCKVFIVTLPPKYKDVCEYFSDNDSISFKKLLEVSPSYESVIVEKYSSLYPIIDSESFINNEYPTAKWIIEGLIRVGGISFLVGESGTGKTITTLSMVKAISTGSPWLDKFPTTKMNVLIIDKENTPADIQKLFKTIGIKSPNVYTFFTEENYNLIDESGKPTEISEYLSLFVQSKSIDLIILDSAIDFLIGDENSSTDVAANIAAWRAIFQSASIISIHHESKQDPRNKKKAADRMRGSSVWLSAAQSVLSLSVTSIIHPERLLIEHSKVRGGKKATPFEIEMVIRPDPYNMEETIVDGFKYLGEVIQSERMEEKAKQAILDYLIKRQTEWVTAKDIKSAIADQGIGRVSITNALKELVTEESIELDDSSKAFLYKVCVKGVYGNVEDFIKNGQAL